MPLLQRLLPSACVLALLAASACSPVVATRGYMTDPEKLAAIKPGVSTQEGVLSVLGSPSTMGTFDDKTWYYIGQQTEQTAFFKPEVTERRIVAISFDDTGLVKEVKELNKDDGKEVAVVDRKTPTKGREVTVLEQFFGNLGKFNSEGKGPGK